MTPVIRPLKREDVSVLATMEQQIFSVPWSENSFLELLTRDYNECLVAEYNNEVVGCAVLTVLGNEGDIEKVMVQSQCRGRGIASSLVEELLNVGRSRGVENFTLEVRAGNAVAIALYKKYGFCSEGIRPRFYEKPVEDAMIMWLRQ